MKFVANLNLKGHQFFNSPCTVRVLSHDLFSVYLWEYLKFRNEFAANLSLNGHQFFFTHPVQGLPKKPQTIENKLLLEFQWPSTKLNPRVQKLLT